MKKPDARKMRAILATNDTHISKEELIKLDKYIELSKLSDEDILYEYVKVFGDRNVPQVKIAITTDGSEVWVPEGNDIVIRTRSRND